MVKKQTDIEADNSDINKEFENIKKLTEPKSVQNKAQAQKKAMRILSKTDFKPGSMVQGKKKHTHRHHKTHILAESVDMDGHSHKHHEKSPHHHHKSHSHWTFIPTSI